MKMRKVAGYINDLGLVRLFTHRIRTVTIAPLYILKERWFKVGSSYYPTNQRSKARRAELGLPNSLHQSNLCFFAAVKDPTTSST